METDKLIQTVYSGCSMAADSITNLKEYVDNEEMLDLLNKQQNKYYKLKGKAKLILEKMGVSELCDLSKAKMMAKCVMKMRMMTNRTKEKVAKMLSEGANQGLEDIAIMENLLSEKGEKIPEISLEYRKLLLSNKSMLEKYL